MYAAEQTARRHILAVNDSVELLTVLQEFLEEEHYAVTTATFRTTTFDQIVTLAPTLLILDLVDGHQVAWDLLARIGSEASTRDIPILVMSTSQRVLDAAQHHHAHINGQHYLRKPFDFNDLLRIVSGGPSLRSSVDARASDTTGSGCMSGNRASRSATMIETIASILSSRATTAQPSATLDRWTQRLTICAWALMTVSGTRRS